MPSVEPKICNCRMNRRRRSADGSSPVVAPQVTSRPPRTSARIAAGQTASPTFSSDDIDATLPRDLHLRGLDDVSALYRGPSGPRRSKNARSSFVASREVTIVRAPSAFAICVAASETEPPSAEDEDRLARLEARFRRDHSPRREPGDAEGRRLEQNRASRAWASTLPTGAHTNSVKVPSTCSPKIRPLVHRTSSPLRQNSQVSHG